VAWEQQFDLIVMTGHAFQVLLTEDDIRTTLVSARRALRPGGRFAFETRNPLVRGWEGWTPENAREVTTSDGAQVRIEHRVQSVEGGVVEMSESFISERWDEPQVSYGSLRFLSADELSSYLDEAGLTIEAQFGDWDRSPFTATSPEIITITRN
jgi:SAM-dependent methyltransferase